jgi:hypothetical protein
MLPATHVESGDEDDRDAATGGVSTGRGSGHGGVPQACGPDVVGFGAAIIRWVGGTTTVTRSMSRRRVLASLGAAGALSAVGGSGTVAFFADEERPAADFLAGEVDVSVECDDCTLRGGRLEIDFDALDPGESGSKTVTVTVDSGSNPVSLWLRTTCPPAVDPLGEALRTRLSVSTDCDGDADEQLFPTDAEWGSLTELRRTLADGVRIDDECLDAESSRCLLLEYELPADTTWAVESEATIALDLFGQQCRHASATATSPFETRACPGVSCPDCVRLGKLEVTDDPLESGTTYDFEDVFAPFDGDGHDYALEVLTVTDKVDDGERETVCAGVRLLRDGTESAAPPLCAVAVGGGRPAGAGRRVGEGPEIEGKPRPADPDARQVEYDVDPPLTRTRGQVCAAHDKSDPTAEADGERPAISNVTVFVCDDGAANEAVAKRTGGNE